MSGAIREACGGLEYQREVRERLDEEFGEPLGPDDCLVTGPGTCNAFRWVLHVASVDYQNPDPETQGPSGPTRVLRCAVAALRGSAELARDNDLAGRFVVATPLLGAGHGGVGSVIATDRMMAGAKAFLSETTPEVRLAIARLVVVVLQSQDARLVSLAAGRHGLPFESAAR